MLYIFEIIAYNGLTMNQRYFSWMSPDLKVKNSAVGNGVFANKDIKKNKIIIIFGGYVFTRVEEATLPSPMNDYAHQISPEFVIGIRKKTQLQPVDHINHSCSPNTGFKGQIFLVAMRDIKKGEEITFDYCMVLYRAKGVKKSYRFSCRCGSRECRKIVTWNDWKITKLQKKYRGYFQWYLEEKINNLKK